MKRAMQRIEKGQSLVLIALMAFVLIGMLALVLDGGNAYFQRRIAQTAADAGSLAGARELCQGNGATAAYDLAEEYACNRNGADLPPDTIIDVDDAHGRVSVTASIAFNNFFASIFGQPNSTVTATATAGCFSPCLGEGVLPVVWVCKPEAEGSEDGKPACEDLPVPQETIDDYINDPETTTDCVEQFTKKGHKSAGYTCPELTIVMDNIDIDYEQCDTYGGAVECDFDGDGDDDYVSAENRGWADLDGNVNAFYSCDPTSEGASELTDWILNGYDCPFEIHTWVGDQSGAATNIYHAVEERRLTNPIVILPVFDDSCPGDPRTTPGCDYHTGAGVHPPDDLVHEFTSASNYYHIIRFAAFYITCVQENQHNDPCPGGTAFYNENYDTLFKGKGYDDDTTGNKYQTIEGYFIKGYVPGLEGKCGTDISTGVYTLYLDD